MAKLTFLFLWWISLNGRLTDYIDLIKKSNNSSPQTNTVLGSLPDLNTTIEKFKNFGVNTQ